MTHGGIEICILLLLLLKVKECHTPGVYRRGAHLPEMAVEPVSGYTTVVCDAWPVQTYSYLPSLSWYSLHLPTEGWPG